MYISIDSNHLDHWPAKITIPKALFVKTVSLLNEIDIEGYPYDLVRLFGYVHYSFNHKRDEVERCSAFDAFLSDDEMQERCMSIGGNSRSDFFDDVPF